MVGASPPRYRHDGTSPLPLGMDASPAPSRWTGANTVWPHDPRTGWSYCVTIPSWVALPEAKTADGNYINRTVFFKVHVGIQSPQGMSTLRVVLRRFSDFLKLYAALKRTFLKKELPPPPPKNSFMRVNSSQTHLHERRSALGEWIAKLLADIAISRCAPMASFLELEAAARAAMNTATEAQSSSNSGDPSPKSTFSWTGGSSSVTSGGFSSIVEYGSDAVFDTRDTRTPKRTSEQGSEIELEDLVIEEPTTANDGGAEITGDMTYTRDEEESRVLRVDKRAPEEQDQLTLKDKDESSDKMDGTLQINSNLASISKNSQVSGVEKLRVWHGRRPSQDSISSEVSSVRGSEISTTAAGDGPNEGSLWSYGGKESSIEMLPSFDADFLKGAQLALPMDQRGKVRRLLLTLQRRLSTGKADMENLIARLNQETAVKEFLATKVRDLEGELDNTRRKSRDVLEQAVSMERETFTNLQWELEECRAALMNADEQAQIEQKARVQAEEKLQKVEAEKKKLEDVLGEMKEKVQNLQKDKDRIEVKAKADIRILAKEIKSLRESQPGIRNDLELALQAKAELEATMQKERQWQEKKRTSRTKFLHEVETLRQRLQECSVDVLTKEENKTVTKSPGVSNAIDLLMTSDNRIGLLLAEAQLLGEESDDNVEIEQPQGRAQLPNGIPEKNPKTHLRHVQETKSEEVLRRALVDIFIDNAQLRKALNSLTRNALVMASTQEKSGGDEAAARKSVLNRFL